MATTFEVEWNEVEERVAEYVPSAELDKDGWPEDYSLDLTKDATDWCEQTETELPELTVDDWAGNQEHPGIVMFSFQDDAAAQLFRLRWLNRIESTKTT